MTAMNNLSSGNLFAMFLLIASGLTFTACNKADTVEIPPPPDLPPPYDWPTASFESQSIDSDSIQQAKAELLSEPYVEGFVLVRNGYLVDELYPTLAGKYIHATIASVTKSFTSAIVGVALREGLLDSVGQRLLEFFPEYVTPSLDTLKRKITLEHLLTMRAGFDYVESADHSALFNESTDWMREAIDIPLRLGPGMEFNYSSVNAHLISGIITKATGTSTLDFARPLLFDPLGITILSWPRDPQGYYFGGSGLMLYPRDMARLGQMYLDDGLIDGLRILPSSWVQESTQPHVEPLGAWGEFEDLNYGYFWWTARWRTENVFMAVGYGGQFIICVPSFHLTVVLTSDPNCTLEESNRRHFVLLDIIARHVLTAVH